MINRFDLEQQILGCWNIVEDLDYILPAVDEMNDNAQNMVLGLKTLYQAKFEKLFDMFSECIKHGIVK